MNEIAAINQIGPRCATGSEPRPMRTPRILRLRTKNSLSWLCAAGGAGVVLTLGVLAPDQAEAWIAGIWRPETLAMMFSAVVGLASWAATRSWTDHAEDIPLPPNDDLAQNQIALRDRLGRALLDSSERRQYHFSHHVEVGVVRQLDGVALLARLLEKRLSEQDRPEAADVAKLRELVERTISEARLLAASAYPPEIESAGLEEALRRMAEEAEKYQTYCRVVEGSSCPKTDAATSLQLYRVVQVVVERAVRHGKAHHILVELAAGPEKYMSMTVTDRVSHGDKLPELTETEIGDLQARLRSVGGALHIEQPAGGLRLTCRMMVKGPKLQS
ncbi:MAG: hypothetical protein WD733_00420 [Bryobacterales bacterium]